jgi:hypothetical protein
VSAYEKVSLQVFTVCPGLGICDRWLIADKCLSGDLLKHRCERLKRKRKELDGEMESAGRPQAPACCLHPATL